MTQDEIRARLAQHAAVVVQVAQAGDGSPEIAWGDTFFYVRDRSGVPKTMPFGTIVIKDYVGFDEASNLNRGGLFRLNLEVGKAKLESMFGVASRELEAHRDRFDPTALDTFFPHPTYGAHGWVSIIEPSAASDAEVGTLLDLALDRALRRVTHS